MFEDEFVGCDAMTLGLPILLGVLLSIWWERAFRIIAFIFLPADIKLFSFFFYFEIFNLFMTG